MADNDLKAELTKSIVKSDPKFIESLEEDFQSAKRRIQKRDLGAPKSVREKRGFTPSALRIRGEIIGKDEFSKLNLAISNLIKDIDVNQQFADAQTKVLERDKLFKATSEVRKQIVSRGSEVNLGLAQQKLDAKVSSARLQQFADIFQTAGFAIGMASMRGGGGTLSGSEAQLQAQSAGGGLQNSLAEPFPQQTGLGVTSKFGNQPTSDF